MTFQIEIRGIPALKAKLGDKAIGAALRTGMAQAGLIVQEAAQTKVHSPDNPYVGKAGYSVATGRLQASIGTSPVEGTGVNLTVKVGTPYGKGGVPGSVFARSAARTTGRGRFRNRTGGRRNTGDVRVYGPIEERRHPFLGPSLTENAQRIVNVIQAAFNRLFAR